MNEIQIKNQIVKRRNLNVKHLNFCIKA